MIRAGELASRKQLFALVGREGGDLISRVSKPWTEAIKKGTDFSQTHSPGEEPITQILPAPGRGWRVGEWGEPGLVWLPWIPGKPVMETLIEYLLYAILLLPPSLGLHSQICVHGLLLRPSCLALRPHPCSLLSDLSAPSPPLCL